MENKSTPGTSTKRKRGGGLIEPVVKKASSKPCGLITRQRELAELGRPADQAGCFGCCYVGELDYAAAAYEDIMALFNIVRKSIARTDPINLVIYLATRYKIIQDDVNSHLQPGEEPLPDWTSATILEHVRSHNTDPEIQLWLRISEMQELAQIALHASVEYNPDTEEYSVNEKQCKIYLDIIKTLESYSKSDPSKKVFYSGGNHIDMKAASSGFMNISGKRLISYLRKK
ncbi:MAG: hypothetical protein QM498_06285 [Desulfobacterium sp.]